MERGLPNLGRTDQVVDNETGTHYFFKAYLGSLSVLPVPIPPKGTATLTRSFVLTRSSDAARFGAVQNITEYAAQVRGNGTVMPWLHWVQLVVEVFTGLLLSGGVASAMALSPMLVGVVFVSPDSVPAFLFHYGFLLFVLGFVVDLVGTSTGLALREKYFLRRGRPVSFGPERK